MTTKEHPCLKCKEHCCIGPIGTFLTLEDAKRISDFTKKKMSDFCFYGNIASDKKEQEFLMLTKDHSYFEISNTGKILQLRAKKNGECIFLDKLKCKVYDSRPLVCRIFPVGYKKNGKLCFFEEDEYCSLMDKKCHKQTAKNIGLSVNEVKRLVKQHVHEIENYRKYEKYFIEGLSSEEVYKKINS